MSEIRTMPRRSPFAAFTSLEREIRSLADRMGMSGVFEDFDWKPATDVYKDDGKLFVKAEVPGILVEDLNIEVAGNVLSITGEKNIEREVVEEDSFIKERTYGSFKRDVVLPDGVDPDSIEAHYEGGVLTVSVDLPRDTEDPSEAAPVRIPVTDG